MAKPEITVEQLIAQLKGCNQNAIVVALGEQFEGYVEGVHNDPDVPEMVFLNSRLGLIPNV